MNTILKSFLPGLLFCCFFLFLTCEKKEPVSPQTFQIVTFFNNENIYSDQVWKSNEIHIVTKVISINNAILRIEPGTIIKFEKNAGISVNDDAGLIADGSDSTIYFTFDTQEKGFWKYILLTKNSLADSCKLINCIIKYGGGDSEYTGAVVCDNISPVIRGCNITQNLHSGVILNGNCREIEFCNNSITFCDSAPVETYLNPQNFGTDETNFILVRGGYHEGAIVVDGHWKNFDVPYKLNNTVQIISSTLTIDASVRIIMSELSGFEILSQAGLIADGKLGQIIIEGEKHYAGYWKNIYFSKNANINNCQLINCQIKYGGGDINQPGMIYCDQNSPVIRNCYIENSGTWGIYVNGNFTIQDLNTNVFYNNVNGDFYSSP